MRMRVTAIAAEEDVAHLARHVERREQRAEDQHVERAFAQPEMLRGFEDAVFRPEAGKEDGNAAESHHADCVSSEGQGHPRPQSAHPPYVLLFVAAVNHRACAHEQQSFEERVRDEVEHAYRYTSNTEARHHVAKLRDCRVGKNALDIVLRDGDQGCEQCCECTYPGDHAQRCGCAARRHAGLHQRVDACDEINTCATMVAA